MLPRQNYCVLIINMGVLLLVLLLVCRSVLKERTQYAKNQRLVIIRSTGTSRNPIDLLQIRIK